MTTQLSPVNPLPNDLTPGNPELKIDYAVDAGKGATVGVDIDMQSEMYLPKLIILQAQTPFVINGGKDYVEGAMPSYIMNLGTKDVFNGQKGVFFVPCFKFHCFEERTPVSNEKVRGNYVATHQPKSPVVRSAVWTVSGQRKFMAIPNGNHLDELFRYYGMLLPGGPTNFTEFYPIVMEFRGMNIAVAKELNQHLINAKVMHDGKEYQLPIWGGAYHFCTRLEQKGTTSFYIYKINPAMENGQPILYRGRKQYHHLVTDAVLYDTCRAFHEACSYGLVTPEESSDEYDAPDAAEISPGAVAQQEMGVVVDENGNTLF